MIDRAPIRGIRARGGTVSPYYIGYWPMTQLNAAGSYDSWTLLNSTSVDTANDYWTGFTGAPSVFSLGARVRIRADAGALPGATPTLTPTTTYYMGIPGGNTDRRTLHLTSADAIAGTNVIDLTSQSVPRSTIFYIWPDIRDDSGNGNHLTLGTSLTDTTIYGDIPYLSSGSSASNPVELGRLAVATFNSYWQWPDSLLFCAHLKMTDTAAGAGRAIAGCGMSGANDGPRYSLGPVDTEQLNCQMYYGGSGASASSLWVSAGGASASHPFVVDEPFHFACLMDGYNQLGFCWVDGVLDLGVQYRSMSAVTTVTPAADFCIGGVPTPNSQACGFREVHLLSIPSTTPIDMTKIHKLVLMLAGAPGYRVMDGDI